MNIHQKKQYLFDTDAQVKLYFDLVVPLKLRGQFKELSVKHYPVFAATVYNSRKKIMAEMQDMSGVAFKRAVQNYENDSKRLMRMVMYASLGNGLRMRDQKETPKGDQGGEDTL